MHSGTPTSSNTTPPCVSVTLLLRIVCYFLPPLILAKNSRFNRSFSCFCSRRICSSYCLRFSFSCCIFRLRSACRISSCRCFSIFCFIISARFCRSWSIYCLRTSSYSRFCRFFSSLNDFSALLELYAPCTLLPRTASPEVSGSAALRGLRAPSKAPARLRCG